MGGPGSGNHWGFGKPTTENYRCVDVRRLARDGLLQSGNWFNWRWTRDGEEISSITVRFKDDAVEFSYRLAEPGSEGPSVRQTAALEWTPCHLGGARVWFLCPSCGRRSAKLYLSGRVGCRVCFGLAYESQREDRSSRLLRRAQNIRKRLDGSGNMSLPFPDKPKGMHWRTYWRMRARAEALEMAMWGATAERFNISIE